MMKSCESYEMYISALVDGESSRADTLAILDHMPACPSCQAFYRDCRELQEVTDRLPVDADSVRETGAPARIVRLRRPAPWVWAAAAGIALLFVAGAIGLRPAGTSGADAGARVIDLSTQFPSAPMNDARFMEISVALLHSEPRYQRTMIEILERFERSRGLDESSIDVASTASEADEPWTSSTFDDDQGRGATTAQPQP